MNTYSFYQQGEDPNAPESTERFDLPDHIGVDDFDSLFDYVLEEHGSADWWEPGKPVVFTVWVENTTPFEGEVYYEVDDNDFEEEVDED